MIENLYAGVLIGALDWNAFVYIATLIILGWIASMGIWVWLDDVFGDR